MDKFQGTPGPWRFFTSYGCLVTTSRKGILEGSKEICEVSEIGREESLVHANAQLIAAAPDLLEALQSALSFIEELEERNIVSNFSGKSQIVQAIAKALGKEAQS